MSGFNRRNIARVACDGGCRGNAMKENIGGWGALIELPDYCYEIFGSELNTTNNAMELKACIESLRSIQDKNIEVEVTVDSAYVLNGAVEWSKYWVRNDWKTKKGTDVANKDLWMDLLTEKNKFKFVKFIKCKGHSDHAGNIRADELANYAMDGIMRDNFSRKLHTI